MEIILYVTLKKRIQCNNITTPAGKAYTNKIVPDQTRPRGASLSGNEFIIFSVVKLITDSSNWPKSLTERFYFGN